MIVNSGLNQTNVVIVNIFGIYFLRLIRGYGKDL